MGVFWAIIGGIVGAVVGFVAAALLSSVIMSALGVSNIEGQRGMTAALFFGPMGGLLGLGLGIWLALKIARGRVSLGAFARQGSLAVLGIAALVGLVLLIVWQSQDHRLTYDGAGATLEFEIGAPAGYPLPPESGAVDIELDTQSTRMSGYLDSAWLRRDGDWTVMSGGVELYLRTAHRLLVLRLPDGRDRLFRLRLPSKPEPSEAWSDWQKVDFVGLPDQPQTVTPGPEDPFEIRYRVRVWGQQGAPLLSRRRAFGLEPLDVAHRLPEPFAVLGQAALRGEKRSGSAGIEHGS